MLRSLPMAAQAIGGIGGSGLAQVRIPASLVTAGPGWPQRCSRHGVEATRRVRCRFVALPPVWFWSLIPAMLFLGVVPMVRGYLIRTLLKTLARRPIVEAPAWPTCPRCRRRKLRLLSSGVGLMLAAPTLFILSMVLGDWTSGCEVSGCRSTWPDNPLWIAPAAAPLVMLPVGIIMAAHTVAARIAGGWATADGAWVHFRSADPAFVEHVESALAGPAGDLPVSGLRQRSP